MSRFSVYVGLGAVAIGGAVVAEWRMNAGLMIADPTHDYLPTFAATASSAATTSSITYGAVIELRDTTTGDEITGKPEESTKQLQTDNGNQKFGAT